MKNNARDLKKEIRRCWDELQKCEVGSVEYNKKLECYNTLLSQEKELKKIRADKVKGVAAGAIGIGGMLLYRKLIDKSADPFFKEIGKSMLKIVHI